MEIYQLCSPLPKIIFFHFPKSRRNNVCEESILKSSKTIGQILKQFITLESGLVYIFLQDLYLRKQKKKK